MSEVIFAAFELNNMNGLVGTKIKKIKMDTWHKIWLQLEANLDFACALTLIYYIWWTLLITQYIF